MKLTAQEKIIAVIEDRMVANLGKEYKRIYAEMLTDDIMKIVKETIKEILPKNMDFNTIIDVGKSLCQQEILDNLKKQHNIEI
jgi:hypothetical protein